MMTTDECSAQNDSNIAAVRYHVILAVATLLFDRAIGSCFSIKYYSICIRCSETQFNHFIVIHLTDCYLLKDEDFPFPNFDIICTASNFRKLFHNIHPKQIMSFIHAVGLTISGMIEPPFACLKCHETLTIHPSMECSTS